MLRGRSAIARGALIDTWGGYMFYITLDLLLDCSL